MPTDGFWDGVASSLERASGDIIAIGLILIAILFIIIKYYMPERSEQKKFQKEMQLKQLELEAKRQQDAVDVQRENIESRTRQVEILVNLSEQTKSLASQTAGLATQVAVAIAQLEDSKANSAKMGSIMTETADDVRDIKSMTREIHSVLYHPDVVD